MAKSRDLDYEEAMAELRAIQRSHALAEALLRDEQTRADCLKVIHGDLEAARKEVAKDILAASAEAKAAAERARILEVSN